MTTLSDEGLIDPSAFPIPDTLTYLLDSAAAKLKADGTDLTDTAGDITGAWAGLDGIYSAPESATLFNVLNPLTGDADEVSSALSSASDALIDFAEKTRDIKDRWYTLRSDSYAFLQSIDYGRDEDWDEGSGMLWWKEESPKVAEHNALLDRAAALKHEFEEAERTCANAITALFGGTTFIAQRADGSVTPGAGEFVYGFDAPLEGVEMEWGAPQTSDYAWYTDATDAVGDYVVGMAEDLGGMVGAHGPEGWFSGSWGDNLWDYWGGTVEGLGSLVGASRDENGNWGWSLETAGNAWKEAAHSVVPWREWGDRPWYVIGTAALNIGATVGGALLTATGVGAVVGVPLLAWRGSRILDGVNGGRADADLPDGGGVDLQTLMSRVPSFGDGSIQPVDLSRLADLDLDQGEFGRMTDALQRLNDLDGGDGASPDRPGNSDNRTVPVDDADGVGGDNGSAPRANTAPGDEPEAAERRGSSDRDRDDAEGDGADQDAEEPTYPTTELLDSSQDFLDGVDPESVRGLREGMDGQENDWVTSQVPDDVSSVNDTPVQRYESEPSRVEAGNERPEELVLAGRGEHEIAEGADGERVDARHDTTVDNSAGGTTSLDSPRGGTTVIETDSGRGGSGGGTGGGGTGDGPPHSPDPGGGNGSGPDDPLDGDSGDGGGGDEDLPSNVQDLANHRWGDTPEGRKRFYQHFQDLLNDRSNGVFDRFYQDNGYRRSRFTKVGPEEIPLPKLTWDKHNGRWIVQETLPAADPPDYKGDVNKRDALVSRDPANDGYTYLDELAERRRSAITADGTAGTRLQALEARYKEHLDAGGSVPRDLAAAREVYAERHTDMLRASEGFGEATADIAILDQFDGTHPALDSAGRPVLDENGDPVNKPRVTEQITLPDTSPRNGNHQFDQVWRTEDGGLVVVEAKSSTDTQLGTRLAEVPNSTPVRVSQGTRAYLESILESMRERGESDARNAFTEEDLADEIQAALENGKLHYVEVKGNPITNYDDQGQILDSRSEGYSFREFDLDRRAGR